MIVIQLTVGKYEVTTKRIRLFVNNTKQTILYSINILRGKHTERQRQRQASSVEVTQCKSMVTLGNGSGTDFQGSQSIPMDLDAATDADARCVHTLKAYAKFEQEIDLNLPPVSIELTTTGLTV